MFFVVMMGAQRVMIMVPMTAVACVREHNVLVLVIADPIVAAFGLGQVSLLSAKTTAIFEERVLGLLFCLGHVKIPINNAYIMVTNNFHHANRACGTAASDYPGPECTFIYSNAFPLDSKSQFMVIYRGGKILVRSTLFRRSYEALAMAFLCMDVRFR
jgi:hypothetical protein